HRGFGGFEGRTELQFSAWLRTILGHNIAGLLRDHTRAAKRNVRRERSMNDSRGGEPLSRTIVAGHTPPSQRAMRAEDFARLAREHRRPGRAGRSGGAREAMLPAGETRRGPFMTSREQDDAPQAKLDRILADFMERLDRGEPVDRERFVADHPGFADELFSY